MQRLRHQRSPAPREISRIQRAESGAIAARKSRVRRKRGVRMLILLAVMTACVTLAHHLLTSRVVVRGLVEADVVPVTAPSRVRVAQLFVATGQRCHRGDPLLTLESLDGAAERRVLQLAVEEEERRLTLIQAGADLGTTDLARRQERLSDARVELETAEAGARKASAEWQALIRERERQALELEQDKARTSHDVAALDARVQALQAEGESAGASRVLAELDAQQNADLHAEGLVSERTRVAAEVGRRIAQEQWKEAGATLDAAREDLENARKIDDLEEQRGGAVLAETDAKIAAAQRALELELARRDLWQQVVSQRAALLPADPVAPGTLRDLEGALAKTELEAAKAKLEAYDARVGNTVVRAALDGVVDGVFVRAGSVAEADSVLLRYHDPSALRVEGYVQPGDDLVLEPGATCRIVPEGRSHAIAGSVAAVGSSWEPCPAALLVDGTPEANPRLPFRVAPETDGLRRPLRPGMRVRLVFER